MREAGQLGPQAQPPSAVHDRRTAGPYSRIKARTLVSNSAERFK